MSQTNGPYGQSPGAQQRPHYVAAAGDITRTSAFTPSRQSQGRISTSQNSSAGITPSPATPARRTTAKRIVSSSSASRLVQISPSAYERFDEVSWIVDLSTRISNALQSPLRLHTHSSASASPSATSSQLPIRAQSRVRLPRPSREFRDLQQKVQLSHGSTLASASPDVSADPGASSRADESSSAMEWVQHAQDDFERRRADLERSRQSTLKRMTGDDSYDGQDEEHGVSINAIQDSSDQAAVDPAVERSMLAAKSLQELMRSGGLQPENADDEQVGFADLLANAEPLPGRAAELGPSSLFEANRGSDGTLDIESILRQRARMDALDEQSEADPSRPKPSLLDLSHAAAEPTKKPVIEVLEAAVEAVAASDVSGHEEGDNDGGASAVAEEQDESEESSSDASSGSEEESESEGSEVESLVAEGDRIQDQEANGRMAHPMDQIAIVDGAFTIIPARPDNTAGQHQRQSYTEEVNEADSEGDEEEDDRSEDDEMDSDDQEDDEEEMDDTAEHTHSAAQPSYRYHDGFGGMSTRDLISDGPTGEADEPIVLSDSDEDDGSDDQDHEEEHEDDEEMDEDMHDEIVDEPDDGADIGIQRQEQDMEDESRAEIASEKPDMDQDQEAVAHAERDATLEYQASNADPESLDSIQPHEQSLKVSASADVPMEPVGSPENTSAQESERLQFGSHVVHEEGDGMPDSEVEPEEVDEDLRWSDIEAAQQYSDDEHHSNTQNAEAAPADTAFRAIQGSQQMPGFVSAAQLFANIQTAHDNAVDEGAQAAGDAGRAMGPIDPQLLASVADDEHDSEAQSPDQAALIPAIDADQPEPTATQTETDMFDAYMHEDAPTDEPGAIAGKLDDAASTSNLIQNGREDEAEVPTEKILTEEVLTAEDPKAEGPTAEGEEINKATTESDAMQEGDDVGETASAAPYESESVDKVELVVEPSIDADLVEVAAVTAKDKDDSAEAENMVQLPAPIGDAAPEGAVLAKSSDGDEVTALAVSGQAEVAEEAGSEAAASFLPSVQQTTVLAEADEDVAEAADDAIAGPISANAEMAEPSDGLALAASPTYPAAEEDVTTAALPDDVVDDDRDDEDEGMEEPVELIKPVLARVESTDVLEADVEDNNENVSKEDIIDDSTSAPALQALAVPAFAESQVAMAEAYASGSGDPVVGDMADGMLAAEGPVTDATAMQDNPETHFTIDAMEEEGILSGDLADRDSSVERQAMPSTTEAATTLLEKDDQVMSRAAEDRQQDEADVAQSSSIPVQPEEAADASIEDDQVDDERKEEVEPQDIEHADESVPKGVTSEVDIADIAVEPPSPPKEEEHRKELESPTRSNLGPSPSSRVPPSPAGLSALMSNRVPPSPASSDRRSTASSFTATANRQGHRHLHGVARRGLFAQMSEAASSFASSVTAPFRAIPSLLPARETRTDEAREDCQQVAEATAGEDGAQVHGQTQRPEQTSRPKARAEPVKFTMNTRSHCLYRRLELTDLPGAPIFIVPGCSINYQDAQHERAQDLGETSEQDSDNWIDVDPELLPPDVHHILSRIIGLQILREGIFAEPDSSAAKLLLSSYDLDMDLGTSYDDMQRRSEWMQSTSETQVEAEGTEVRVEAAEVAHEPKTPPSSRHRRSSSAASALSDHRSPRHPDATSPNADYLPDDERRTLHKSRHPAVAAPEDISIASLEEQNEAEEVEDADPDNRILEDAKNSDGEPDHAKPEESEESAAVSGSQPKRKRGRPRKSAPAVINDQPSAEEEKEAGEHATGTPSTPKSKKRRGRKRAAKAEDEPVESQAKDAEDPDEAHTVEMALGSVATPSKRTRYSSKSKADAEIKAYEEQVVGKFDDHESQTAVSSSPTRADRTNETRQDDDEHGEGSSQGSKDDSVSKTTSGGRGGSKRKAATDESASAAGASAAEKVAKTGKAQSAKQPRRSGRQSGSRAPSTSPNKATPRKSGRKNNLKL